MEVVSTSVYAEMMNIFSTPAAGKEFDPAVTFHLPNESLEIDQVYGIQVSRDYVEQFGDQIVLTIGVGIATFTQKILPVKRNIEVELILYPLVNGTREQDPEKPVQAARYRGVILDTDDYDIKAGNELTTDIYKGDQSERKAIRLQLLDPILNEARAERVAGIYAGNMEDIIRGLMSPNFANRTQHETSVKGVEIVTPDNPTKFTQMLIPPTLLVDLPDYLQKRYGIYKNNVGVYLQHDLWWVWSLYDTDRFDTADKTATVIVVDQNTMPVSDNSFLIEDDDIYILSTGDVHHQDKSEHRLLEFGNGVRYQDTDNLIDTYSKTVSGRTTITRSENVREYVLEGREDGFNFLNHSGLTTNHLDEVSKINVRRGGLVRLPWESSDPTLLYPGMGFRVIYRSKDDVKVLKAILVGSHSLYTSETEEFTDTPMRCKTVLSLWIERNQT